MTPAGPVALAAAHVMANTPWGPKHADTDATGRYVIHGLHDLLGNTDPIPVMSIVAMKDGYSLPCRPSIDAWLRRAADDVLVHLVPNALLQQASTPPHLPLSATPLKGIVRRRGGGPPAAGAVVRLSFGLTLFDVNTVTDNDGRFLFCGLTERYRRYWDEGGVDYPDGQAWLAAQRSDGAWSSQTIDVRTSPTLTIEID